MDETINNTDERGITTAAELVGRIAAARHADGDLIILTDDGQEVVIRNYSDPAAEIEIILPNGSRIDGMTAATWMTQIGAVIARGGIEPTLPSEIEETFAPASAKPDNTVLDEEIAADAAGEEAIAGFETAAGDDESQFQSAPNLPGMDQSDINQGKSVLLSKAFASREEFGRPANDTVTPIQGRSKMAERREDDLREESPVVSKVGSEQIADRVDSILEEIMGIKLHGGRDDDELFGTDGDDILNGRNGDDNIIGFGGNDRLIGGRGDDRMFGGEGNDRLNGGKGEDELHGGDGRDIIVGARGNDRLFGELGRDRLSGGRGDDFLDGGDGADRLIGGQGNDMLLGGSGDDRLYGNAGDDIIIGGEGNDRIYGGNGADDLLFRFGDGSDTIYRFSRGDELIFEGINLDGGDTLDIKAEGRDVVIEVIGQNGGASRVTLKNAARRMDEVERENISDGYMVNDSGTGTVTVSIEQIA